jgi:hypothetical protein
MEVLALAAARPFIQNGWEGNCHQRKYDQLDSGLAAFVPPLLPENRHGSCRSSHSF